MMDGRLGRYAGYLVRSAHGESGGKPPQSKRWTAEVSGRRGVTLVECLVFLAIWMAVSGATLLAVRESTLLRGQMSQRAMLGTIAQSELERTRALPSAELVEGAHARTNDEWPTGTSCTVALKRVGPLWQMDVMVERVGARRTKPVWLTSVRKGQT